LINTKVQELDIAGACRPPQDLLDGYFQWLTASLGEVAFVIGECPDTTNPASCAYSLIRHYLRVTSGGELVKPKRLAADLNDLISDSRDNQSSVTCFYGHYTGSTRVLRYFNAGHRSPLLLRSNPDQVIRLNKAGPPLGYSQEQSYSEATVQLKTGDRIVAFSRGVAESWATGNDSLGEIALLNIMRGWRHESAAQVANFIVADGPCAARFDSIAIVGSVNGAPSAAHDVCMEHELLGTATS
jgi:serine phosphatase RsbU (regulator of sigma subunit)